MGLYRRRLLCGISLISVSGCMTGSSDSTTSISEFPPQRPSKEDTDQNTLTQLSMSDLMIEDLLPRPGGGWRIMEKGRVKPQPLNQENNLRGDFEDERGNHYRVIIVKFPRAGIAQYHSERWKCEAEWSVVIQYGPYSIAASTGTIQTSFTPERPPQMTRTPIPDMSGNVRELLKRSPSISEEILTNNEITSCNE